MKSIFFTVTTDLTYDQRMIRICSSLANNGYQITLIGRKRSFSKPITLQPFQQIRLRCFFNKGKGFYLEYNLRLFFYLLFKKMDALCAIDLDTILPAFLITKIKRKQLVYDAHDYFPEMVEVVSRPLTQKAWLLLERWIIPQLKHAYTVSEGCKAMFEKKYGTPFEIIRNASVLHELPPIKENKSSIIFQGSVNTGRGLENLVKAMQDIDYNLDICGQGDIFDELNSLTQKLNLQHKVTFHGYIEPEKLREYTLNAYIGITFFSCQGLNNQFSLSNRFFDYMHAGVPQIAMNYDEYRNFNTEFEVALLIDDLDVSTIVNAINKLLNDSSYYERLKKNCLAARQVYNWQNEEKKLLAFYRSVS